jgi:uncharacterized delta-60 repeat protein
LAFESLEDRRLLAAGMLDPTFGFGGMVVTDFAEGSAIVESVAVQNDGKIVVAGRIQDATFNDLALARYRADGTLDSTFGEGGKVITDFGGRYEGAESLALQNDGKIIVAGRTGGGDSDFDFALGRYNTDGTLDSTFGAQGKVIIDFGGLDDIGWGMSLQGDGKIIVAGESDNGSKSDFALARYNADGTLDTSFDGDGKITTDFSGGNDSAWSVAVQSDGKIIVVGRTGEASNSDFALARYNADGTLDSSFGQDGKVSTDFEGRSESAKGVALQNDGKIIVAGSISQQPNITPGFALARYNPDGTLDSSFDGDGKVTTRIGFTNDFLEDVVVQSNGKIVVVGRAYFLPPTYWDVVLVRYNTNGTLDSSFDGDGKVTTDFGLNDYAHSVALQSDGKIIVAGSSGGSGFHDFALARYEGDLIPPPALAGDYNRSGTVDAADYVLWRHTRDAVVAAYSGADGDGDGTIDQDDYDLWKANFGRTLPAASSAALVEPAPFASSVTDALRSFDSASTALLPTPSARKREFQPVKRDISAHATSRDQALLAWLAAKPAPSHRPSITANLSGSLSNLTHDLSIDSLETLELGLASIAESTE